MGAACAELHDRASLCRAHDAAGLGGDQALVVEGDQQQRFQQLALNGRTLDGDDRLLREDGGAFLNRPDVAVQLKIAQIIEEFFIKHLGGAQVGDVLLGKAEVVHSLDKLLQTRHNGVAAAIRHAAEEHIKHRRFVQIPLVQIACGHSQLVEIGHSGKVALYIDHW